MMNDILKISSIRKAKKKLYLALLIKGLDNLSDREKHLLSHLSLDEDIILMLSQGNSFSDEDI